MGIPWRRKPAYEAGKPAAAAVSEGDVEKPAPAPGRDARARSVLDIVKDFQVYLCVFICRPQRLALTHYSRMPPPCQTRRRRRRRRRATRHTTRHNKQPKSQNNQNPKKKLPRLADAYRDDPLAFPAELAAFLATGAGAQWLGDVVADFRGALPRVRAPSSAELNSFVIDRYRVCCVVVGCCEL